LTNNKNFLRMLKRPPKNRLTSWERPFKMQIWKRDWNSHHWCSPNL